MAFENNNVKSVQKNHFAAFPVFELFFATRICSTDMRPQNVTTNLQKFWAGLFSFVLNWHYSLALAKSHGAGEFGKMFSEFMNHFEQNKCNLSSSLFLKRRCFDLLSIADDVFHPQPPFGLSAFAVFSPPAQRSRPQHPPHWERGAPQLSA